MKRFLISAPAYSGDAELIFDDLGKLIRVDITHTNMRPDVMEEFKQRAPVHIDGMTAAFQGANVKITEASIEVSFAMFWTGYNRKLNKSRCIALWNKLSSADQAKAYFGIAAYNKFLRIESWRNKQDPETYLRNRTWENEYK